MPGHSARHLILEPHIDVQPDQLGRGHIEVAEAANRRGLRDGLLAKDVGAVDPVDTADDPGELVPLLQAVGVGYEVPLVVRPEVGDRPGVPLGLALDVQPAHLDRRPDEVAKVVEGIRERIVLVGDSRCMLGGRAAAATTPHRRPWRPRRGSRRRRRGRHGGITFPVVVVLIKLLQEARLLLLLATSFPGLLGSIAVHLHLILLFFHRVVIIIISSRSIIVATFALFR